MVPVKMFTVHQKKKMVLTNNCNSDKYIMKQVMKHDEWTQS